MIHNFRWGQVVSKLSKTPFLMVLIMLLIWEGAVLILHVDAMLLPGIPAVVMALSRLFHESELLFRIFYSVCTIIVVLLISLLVSSLMVILSIRKPFVKRQMHYIEAFFNPLPGIAMLPLVILWMGVSYQAMLFIILHAAFWPMWSQIMTRAEALNNQYREMISVFKVDGRRQFYYIYLLGSMPEILVALKTAWSRGWRALISVEMIFGMVGRHSGMGWLIYERRMYMDTAGLYASLLVVAFLGLILEKILSGIGEKYGRETY